MPTSLRRWATSSRSRRSGSPGCGNRIPRRRTLQQLYKSFHGKGIVLGRNAELMPDRGSAQIFFLDEPHLRQHLPCIPQKGHPPPGQHDAPVGAVKDSQAEFLFQFMDGMVQAGCGDIEFLCGLADGSGIGHSRYIASCWRVILFPFGSFFLSLSQNTVKNKALVCILKCAADIASISKIRFTLLRIPGIMTPQP